VSVVPQTDLQERLYRRWALRRQHDRCSCGAPVTEDDHFETWPVWLLVCDRCTDGQLLDELAVLERDRRYVDG
jgi:hypothetical protein